MTALRKLLAAFLLAAFVCVGLPSVPLAGGADDPGYVGGGGNKGEDSDCDLDPNTPVDDGGPGGYSEPYLLPELPDADEGFCLEFAKSWLVHVLGIIIR